MSGDLSSTSTAEARTDDQDFETLVLEEMDGRNGTEKDPLVVNYSGNEELQRDGKSHLVSRGFLILLTTVSALGGFLFGYDTGVVSGAIIEIRKTFELSSTWLEVIVSVTIAAAALSAILAGFLCDLIGRKPTLIISSLVFTLGAVILGASYYTWMLVIGRIVVGVGIGMAAMAVPMYIAESAPAAMRGKLVVVNVLFITGGQFVATVVDGAFSYLSPNLGWRFMLGLAGIPSLLMFVGLMFVPESPRWLVFHGKKEKAWQVLKKIRPPLEVEEEFESILADFNEHKKSRLSCLDFAVKFCSTRSLLLALTVGCGLQVFQQLGGINTVMYYSASIIQMAGFPDQSAIWLATVPGTSNFVFTIVGLLLVDRLGRRKLLIASVGGTIFSFLLLSTTFVLMSYKSPQAIPYDTQNGTCHYDNCGSCVGNSECGFCADLGVNDTLVYNGTCASLKWVNGTNLPKFSLPGGGKCAVWGENSSSMSLRYAQSAGSDYADSARSDYADSAEKLERKWFDHSCPDSRLAPLAIVALFLYIAFFAPGMGPLPWTVNSEIYPTWARSTAISIATMANWMCNLVVSMTFLTLADNLGQPVTFGLYAGLSLLGLIFIVLFVPETKGRSLEDMESLFQRPYFMKYVCR